MNSKKKLSKLLFKWFICLTALLGVFHAISDHIFNAISSNISDKKTMTFAIVMYLTIDVLSYVALLITFNKIINKQIEEPIHKISEGLLEISRGNLSSRMEFETQYEFSHIKDSFNLMAADLEKASEEQQKFAQEKSTLFSNITHDLKTPLTTIIGYSKALYDGEVTDPIKQKEFLNAIYSKSVRVNSLIDLMFQYNKLENHEYQLKLTQCEMTELIRENIALSYVGFEEKGMELEVDLPNNSVIRQVDKLEFNRAFSNLISNAIIHNRAGTKVLVTLKEDVPLTIIVADTGEAIEEEIRNDIFSPFVCGDTSRNTNNGSGLGLSISKKIIEKHGGTIYLDNNIPGYTKGFVIQI